MNISDHIKGENYVFKFTLVAIIFYCFLYWLVERFLFEIPQTLVNGSMILLFYFAFWATNQAIKLNAYCHWYGTLLFELPERETITLQRDFTTKLTPQSGNLIDGLLIKEVEIIEEPNDHAFVTCELGENANETKELLARLSKQGWYPLNDEDQDFINLQRARYSQV